jgi:hypothetical protein
VAQSRLSRILGKIPREHLAPASWWCRNALVSDGTSCAVSRGRVLFSTLIGALAIAWLVAAGMMTAAALMFSRSVG